uniref:Uncharacterized protein n=1 Tax=Rhizophora mucronata TaxID=61149 RepID=A0A2P2PUP7_RHIMU
MALRNTMSVLDALNNVCLNTPVHNLTIYSIVSCITEREDQIVSRLQESPLEL